ncbi:hypothetical protein Hanom_Chr04g00384221 [Helianthus anomalus]
MAKELRTYQVLDLGRCCFPSSIERKDCKFGKNWTSRVPGPVCFGRNISWNPQLPMKRHDIIFFLKKKEREESGNEGV